MERDTSLEGISPRRAPLKAWTRRRFLTSLSALVLAPSGAFAYARGIEPHWLRVERRELPVADLPAALVGKTLMQLSDLHVGVVDGEFLEKSFETARLLEPDIVVITGDWVSYRNAATLEELAERVPKLPKGRLGTFGVLGNHDYGHNWNMPGVAEKVQRLVEDNGIHVLRNEAVNIEGLKIIGLEDMWGPYFQPREVLRRHGADPSSLVLCHNPDAADSDIWHEFTGWTLSGHTHGGQCKPPFLPPPVLPVRNRRYTAGAFELEGRRRLYINPGLGYLKPLRFNVRPEITLFTLSRAEEPSAEGRRAEVRAL